MKLFDNSSWGDKEGTPPLPPLCKHRMDAVELPDGLTVFASSHHSHREEGEEQPDYGLYLDKIWNPDCIAYTVHWPDFGLPTLDMPIFVQLLDEIRLLAMTSKIEVGCIGGHGRTGTMLACLAVAGGAEPDAAIDHIQEVYCDKAVENVRQAWLVKRVHAEINGLECEPPPEPPATVFGKRDADKDKHSGETAVLRIDGMDVAYCGTCSTDADPDDLTKCPWCGALFEDPGERDQK